MRVLITGGAGYIGSHVALELLTAGHDIHVVDNFVNSTPEALHRVSRLAADRPFGWAHGDIRDEPFLKRAFAGFRPDAVLHCAGLKAVGSSKSDPLTYYDVNVGGALSLLRVMDAAGCRRIVFSSSANVYGMAHYLPIDEGHPVAPANPYGRTKLMIEEIIRDWSHAMPGSAATILRYFNPVGAHASGKIGEAPRGLPDNLMPYLCQVATGQRDELAVFGADYDTRDGTGERDYVHIVDLAAAHMAALDHTGKGGGVQILNIGTGRGITVLEMLRALETVAGRRIPYRIGARRHGDVASSVAGVDKARTVLGWSARHGLEEMCRSAWNWQQNNPEGYGGSGDR